MLTCHWTRTEEVVWGVTETELGGSPGTEIQDQRDRIRGLCRYLAPHFPVGALHHLHSLCQERRDLVLKCDHLPETDGH